MSDKVKHYGQCPLCHTPLSVDSYSWSGGQTEAGTEFWNVNVECDGEGCGWALETGGWCGDYGEYILPVVLDEIKEEKDRAALEGRE